MVFALILVSIGLAVTLGMLLLGNRSPTATPSFTVSRGPNTSPSTSNDEQSKDRLLTELEKRKKDLEEQRLILQDTKEQLKQAKRKLYETKESGKDGRELVKAREDYEANASIQLDYVRSELADALSEVERLKIQRTLAPRAIPTQAVEAAPEAVRTERERPQKVLRELNEAEKEKIERLEQQAAKERLRAAELDRELKRTKGRVETQNRVYLVTKGEFELLKEKFKALEQRSNRTLLEKDLLRRAIKDLEIKTGMAAGKTELTAEEITRSEQSVPMPELAAASTPEEQPRQST